MTFSELLAKGEALLGKLPPETLPHVVDFVEGIVTGDKSKAERAATLAATEALFTSPKGEAP